MVTQGLFGGGEAGDEKKAKAEDFINRYQTGNPTEGYTEEEAVSNFEEVAKVATPEQMRAALQQSVNNLPPAERAQFDEMLKQRQQGKGMIDIDRSGERQEAAGRGGASAEAAGLDDLLGGLLGGMGGGSAGGSSGGGLGDILGGLLGGATAQTQTQATQPAPQDSGGGGGLGDMLGDILSSPAGKAVLAGAAAFAMKEVLGKK